MNENNTDRKRAISTSLKGVIYLVIVMIGIFGITSLMKMAGLTNVDRDAAEIKAGKEQWEENKMIKEANGKLELVKDPSADPAISFLPLGMYLTVTDYENGILKLILDNQSGYQMEYRKVWTLDREKDGAYEELGVLFQKEEGINDPSDVKPVLILDLTKEALECDLNSLGRLEPGNYILHMEDIQAAFSLKEVEE
ncbi:MAG: hypothetical protein KBT01_10070 [Clostridiales bacterium]|nr:hypothetical protein [Candidatus Blautia equi]